MIRRRIEGALWVAAVALTTLAGMRARAVASALLESRSEASPGGAGDVPAAIITPPARRLAAAAEVLAAHDPFRLERKPSDVPYSPAVENAPPPPTKPPRPSLAVVGIVGGPPWEALVEGVPGRQGTVLVRRGDTLSGLRVRSITKDTVRISGMDTTWALAVRRAWQ